MIISVLKPNIKILFSRQLYKYECPHCHKWHEIRGKRVPIRCCNRTCTYNNYKKIRIKEEEYEQLKQSGILNNISAAPGLKKMENAAPRSNA